MEGDLGLLVWAKIDHDRPWPAYVGPGSLVEAVEGRVGRALWMRTHPGISFIQIIEKRKATQPKKETVPVHFFGEEELLYVAPHQKMLGETLSSLLCSLFQLLGASGKRRTYLSQESTRIFS